MFGQGIQNNSQDLPEWFDADREYLDSFPPPKDLSARSGCNQKSCAGLDSWIEATEVCTGTVCGCRKSDYCQDIKFGDVSDTRPGHILFLLTKASGVFFLMFPHHCGVNLLLPRTNLPAQIPSLMT